MQGKHPYYDAIIIGGGPAGVSCAVWLARLGLTPVLVEAQAEVGGLCRQHPFEDAWNASLPGHTGPQVADNLALSLRQAGVPVLLGRRVEQVRPWRGGFAASLVEDGVSIRGRYAVIATGVRPRGLGGVDDAGATAEGVLVGPGEHIVAQDFHGRRVAVLGGGDNAFENALYAMARGAGEVDIYARTVRAQRQFVRRIPAERVTRGGYMVDAGARTVNGRPYDLIMVFYGWEPCVPYARSLALARTPQGFLATDPATAQTSMPGVYAIGEVTQRMHPCVVTAMADGVTAAKAIQARIEARR